VCESAELYKNPLHPYTKALLSAIPIPDPVVTRANKRIILEGDVPSPIDPPVGCRFASRCPMRIAQCTEENPELKEMAPGHFASCFNI
ncbi:MAG: ABC transporter ATP-binding protein, partial [Spirochaetales bacterium]|nr:ABC transporter ATP-binding protein [Spirochaetales bacterium]